MFYQFLSFYLYKNKKKKWGKFMWKLAKKKKINKNGVRAFLENLKSEISFAHRLSAARRELC